MLNYISRVIYFKIRYLNKNGATTFLWCMERRRERERENGGRKKKDSGSGGFTHPSNTKEKR